MTSDEGQQKSETALREEAIVARWREEGTFEKSLAKESPKGEFVFYDGPPFATGLPHMGHLLISSYKDAVGRYKTMRGYHVPRRWGWDCHGLPIETIVEGKLGIKGRKAIEEMGIARFNEEAKNSVLTYVSDWKRYIERIGRWVDFDHSYKTMDNSYIESVWWGLKKIYEAGRLYEGPKVLMYCPKDETPLAKAEIAMDNSYKDVTEESVYVKFKVKDPAAHNLPENTYILAWTTTPWTLPGNVALAVGEEIEYVVLEILQDFGSTEPAEHLVLSKEIFLKKADLNDKEPSLYIWNFGDALVNVKIVGTFSGKELVGIAYEPLYEIEKVVAEKKEKTWTVLPASFVTTEDGTGVVHTAVIYGEDDYQLGKEHDLPMVQLLSSNGHYNDDAPELVRGKYHKQAEKDIKSDLEERGLLFKRENHTHSYPHCYRCGTPLIYNAISSWFIDIQSVKEKMLKENEKVNWYPGHLKEGRFKHIVETAPDWTISRNRFWASPLPIWKNEKTGAVRVLGSLAEVRERTKKSGNTYLMVRHGEAESNVLGVLSSLPENPHGLTEKGKEQIRRAAQALKEKGVTKIIASPILRTKESAELIAEELGFSASDIIYEERIQEWQLTKLNNEPVANIKVCFPTHEERFTKEVEGCENLVSMKRRIGEALYDLEEKYQNETILLVGHEYTLWLAECVAEGADVEKSVLIRGRTEDYAANGEVRELDFVPLPHNSDFELDLHRPYIDEVALLDEDGAALVRVPEVVDCWVESGSMPFAAEHYPFENEAEVERRYPGDFIAEYIAQTRTWFYYMHAIGVLLFGAPSFKNCVTTGTVLAADGSKMSKSKNNFTDPMENIDRYGADALRYYLLGSTVMAAEDVAFKDEELREAHNRYINMLANTYKFYELYKDAYDGTTKASESTHVLDKWIRARLSVLVRDVTEHLDAYDTVRTARELRDFVTDLSTWYVRRSRDRFKSDNAEDTQYALATTREVLDVLARLTAPITPFIAETLYRGLAKDASSVHLANWPEELAGVDETLLTDMATLRSAASGALEARQRAKLKVRQPLASVTLRDTALEGKDELLEVLMDEVNVKEVRFAASQEEEAVLDTELTDALRLEGDVRELVRRVQEMRKNEGLLPQDKVTLRVDADDAGKKLAVRAENELARVAGVTGIAYAEIGAGASIDISGASLTLALVRV